MDKMYEMADLVIVPSVWQEAFGRMVVEAHAAGVPTAASRVGGLPEASGEAGLLVDEFADPRAWESVLQQIVRNPSCLEEKRPFLEPNAQRFTAGAELARSLEKESTRTR